MSLIETTGLPARRLAAHADRVAVADNRWRRYQISARRRYGHLAARTPSDREATLLARGKWIGRALLLQFSGLWDRTIDTGLGAADRPASQLIRYVRSGPSAQVQPRALFDQADYLARTPGLVGTAWAPLAHYLVVGDREGRSPHPLFDLSRYRGRHEVAGRLTGLQHFLFLGAAEGFDPHPLFDLKHYVGQVEALADSGENPLIHYLRQGWRDGFGPHSLFDGAWYLDRYPAAKAAGIAPLLHYVTAGARLGYDPHPLFDSRYWADQRKGGLRAAEPLGDFLLAAAEGGTESPSPYFDSAHYLRQSDGADGVNPLLHYLGDGAFQGLSPSPDFDEIGYLAAHPQTADEGLSALDHWARRADRALPSPAGTVSAQMLLQDLREATRPQSDAYDWAAYEALRPKAAATPKAGALPAAIPWPDQVGVVVLGGADAAAVGRSDILVLCATQGVQAADLSGLDGLGDGAIAPSLFDAAGRRISAGGRFSIDGAALPRLNPAAGLVETASGALVLRRTTLEAAGGLDPVFETAEGALSDLVLRLKAQGRAVRHDPTVALISAQASPAAPTLGRDRQRLAERWDQTIEALRPVTLLALRRAAPDWIAVARALPAWRGHQQPRLPADFGFYGDDPDVVARQAALARRYGLNGFLHEASGPRAAPPAVTDFAHAAAWTGSQAADLALAALAPMLSDATPVRLDGRPLVAAPAGADAGAWRAQARALGLGDLYLVQRGGKAAEDPRSLGFDARLEPVTVRGGTEEAPGALFNPTFRGRLRDYRDLVRTRASLGPAAWPTFETVTPGWDTTPFAPEAGKVSLHASPGAFQAWLEGAITRARHAQAPGERLVVIESWNDWEAGAVLEPDQRYGHGWLEAVANALDSDLLTA